MEADPHSKSLAGCANLKGLLHQGPSIWTRKLAVKKKKDTYVSYDLLIPFLVTDMDVCQIIFYPTNDHLPKSSLEALISMPLLSWMRKTGADWRETFSVDGIPLMTFFLWNTAWQFILSLAPAKDISVLPCFSNSKGFSGFYAMVILFWGVVISFYLAVLPYFSYIYFSLSILHNIENCCCYIILQRAVKALVSNNLVSHLLYSLGGKLNSVNSFGQQ